MGCTCREYGGLLGKICKNKDVEKVGEELEMKGRIVEFVRKNLYIIEKGMSFIPDSVYLRVKFLLKMRRILHLKNPKSYSEKLQWMKINDRNPVYTNLVDKYEVRKFVAAKIGQEYLIPLLGVWDNPEEINFEVLPEKFVLKCTHDSGGVIICKNKADFDIEKAIVFLKQRMKRNYFYAYREWPYKNIKPRIIAEKYMEDQATNELRDYKFFCFDGKVRALFIATERQNKEVETCFDFFDENYEHLDIVNGHPNAKELPNKPVNFEEMKGLASKLSCGMRHIRVDFYEIDGKIYFGEITFFHWSGMKSFKPEKWDYVFGEWIDLDMNDSTKG